MKRMTAARIRPQAREGDLRVSTSLQEQLVLGVEEKDAESTMKTTIGELCRAFMALPLGRLPNNVVIVIDERNHLLCHKLSLFLVETSVRCHGVNECWNPELFGEKTTKMMKSLIDASGNNEVVNTQ